MGIGLRQSLEGMGITFKTLWDESGEIDKKVNDNIKYIDRMVKLFLKAGLKPEDIKVTRPNHFYIKVYRVLEGNTVKHEVISKEDGEKLVKVIQNLSIESHPSWRVSSDETDTKLVYGEEVEGWLKNIEKNRKKYSKL
jgi:hypothetical protein